MSRRFLLIVLMGVALIFMAVKLITDFRAASEQNAHRSQTAHHILNLKQLDIKLNEDALKAASYKLVHFDAVVETVNNLRNVQEQLKTSISKIETASIQKLTEYVAEASMTVENRLQGIEKIKTKVALVQNSAHFIQRMVKEIPTHYQDDFAILLLQTHSELQNYQTFPTTERHQRVNGLIQKLESRIEAIDQGTELENIAQHMRLIFTATRDIADLLERMFEPTSQTALTNALLELQSIQKQQQRENLVQRFVLLGIAAFIGLLLLFILTHWYQAHQKSLRTAEVLTEALKSISEGFAFFDRNDALAFWNDAFQKQASLLNIELSRGLSYDTFLQQQKDSENVAVHDCEDERTYVLTTREEQWLHHRVAKMTHGGHAILCMDLTHEKQTQKQLQLSATIIHNAAEAMMVTDADNVICMVNPAFTQITGYSADDIIGQTPSALSSGHHDASFYQQMYAQLTDSGFWQGEIWNKRKDGEVYPEWLSISTIYAEDGSVQQRVALFTDITSRKKSEERIHYQANYDALTGLPNRNLFTDRMGQAVQLAKRQQERLALLSLDLDNFKQVNDSLGHVIGDELLRHVAERLKSLFRSSDTVARLSGDEFVVILNGATLGGDFEQLLNRVLEKVSAPYQINDATVYTSVSVGVTCYPDDGQSVDVLLQNADTAMFKAKEMGRNAFCFFTPEMNSRAQERHQLEIAMHEALEKGHFVMHYQPIVDPVSGTVISTESLVRWDDPEKGLIPPFKFIPIAEENGLIVPLGEWILRQACKDAAKWYNESDIHVGVSVNLSGIQFKRSNVVSLVKQALRETGLPPNKLTLEITESLLVDDESHVLQTLREIRDLGVLLSIDDFGTGYSSLSYLKKFPITTLKIDRSFINEVLISNEDAALTEAILSMASSLNLKVVAEGVENNGQVAFLLERQCDLIQGYYYSKPLPIEKLLQSFTDKTLSF